VVLAPARPQGAAHDVASAGGAHPVYGAGWALAIALPWRAAEDRPLAPLAEIRTAAAPGPGGEVVPAADDAGLAAPGEAAASETWMEIVPEDERASEAEAAEAPESETANIDGEGV
jgi:hypothetical protein